MNVKKKGNLWENKLANWLRDHGIKAWKDGGSGGGTREKGDVGNNVNITIESKAAKSIKLMDWWDQVERSASIHHNSPVLFIHQDGMPDNQWLVVMHSEDWIEVFINHLKSQGEQKMDPTDLSNNREYKWALQNAISSLKKLEKYI